MCENLLLEIDRRVIKELRKIPNETSEKIIERIEGLRENPLPVGAKKLTDRPGYRIRIGNYRVLYTFDEDN